MGDDRVLTPPTPREIRAELAELVVGDLYGPAGGDEHERFPTYERVTDRYILGRLAPNGALIDPNDQESRRVRRARHRQYGRRRHRW
ncbi:hypothetical protein ACWGKS_29285 [Nocardiopsis sp. NPDC055879]